MKRLFQNVILAFSALVLSTSPAMAHGDEDHSQAAAETAPAMVNDTTAPAIGHEMTAEMVSHTTPQANSSSAIAMLKSLHPATVHFPIALFLLAAFLELCLLARPTAGLRPTIGILLVAGAVGAVVAVLFGWVHTGLWLGGESAMIAHRWLGMAIATTGIFAAFASRRIDSSRTILRVLLVIIAAALLVQGFLGGELAHGSAHLGF